MAGRQRCAVGLMAAMVLLCARGRAQREAVAVAPGRERLRGGACCGRGEADSVDTVLRGMARRAGVIFIGTVVQVRRLPAADGGGAGVVEVEFAVDRGVRGGAVTGGAVRAAGVGRPVGRNG